MATGTVERWMGVDDARATRLRPVVAVILLAFAAWSAFVAAKEGYLSVFPPFASLAQMQMFTDLGMSLGLIQIWVFWEAEKSGRPRWMPFLVLIGSVLFGSKSPLVYLLFVVLQPHAASSMRSSSRRS